MNIEQLRKRLKELSDNQKETKNKKKDFKKILWKPKLGKQIIRVVPSKYFPENPFREYYIYQGILKYPFLSLKTFNQKDPIIDFAYNLYKEGKEEGDKQKMDLAKKMFPSLRVVIPIIVRGEEDQGVRLWNISKTTYLDFLMFVDDEDYGDFTDINQGRDITVTGKENEAYGITYIKPKISLKPKTTPLSEDPEQIKEWLENQPNPDDLFIKFDEKKIKEILKNYLDKRDKDKQEKVIKEKIKTKTTKQKEFKDIFGEDEDDDLSF